MSSQPGNATPEGLLCESCGYPLGGLADASMCPECGDPVAESNPARRGGPAWERDPSVLGWCFTVAAMLRRPGQSFRELRVGGSALRARLYVLSVAVACFLNPATVLGMLAGDPRWVAVGLLTVKLVVVLTYLEALGLVVIGRQRGWRLPFAHAERVVAYAATGWLIGVPVAWGLAGLFVLMTTRSGGGLLLDLPGFGGVAAPPGFWLAAGALSFALIALPFEVLAYIGGRRCRYANDGPSPAFDRLSAKG
ncbi:MAG: hypothetical protein AAGK09_03445 [Planctomycetota bacterium]